MKPRLDLPAGVEVKQINLDVDGDQPRRPLIMLNGIGAGTENWGHILEALDRPCVAIDVSRAESCNDRPGMGDYSGALIETVDSLGIDQFDLLGLSWGGALAQEVAIRDEQRIGKLDGQRIGRLVLVATVPGRFSVPPTIRAITALNSSDRTSEAFIRVAGSVYGGDIRRHPELLESCGIMRAVDPDSYKRQKRAILSWNSSILRLMKIQNPTLVMAGADDPIARPINSYMIARAIRRSKLHIVPGFMGGGHLLLHTRPQESAATINRFLDKAA